MNWNDSATYLLSSAEQRRLFWHIFDLEHELGIAGHSSGYNCMECWRLEDLTGRDVCGRLLHSTPS